MNLKHSAERCDLHSSLNRIRQLPKATSILDYCGKDRVCVQLLVPYSNYFKICFVCCYYPSECRKYCLKQPELSEAKEFVDFRKCLALQPLGCLTACEGLLPPHPCVLLQCSAQYPALCQEHTAVAAHALPATHEPVEALDKTVERVTN